MKPRDCSFSLTLYIGTLLGCLFLITGCEKEPEVSSPAFSPVKKAEIEPRAKPSLDEEAPYARFRGAMVEYQLAHPLDARTPVTDKRVLGAMKKVLRHRFVPFQWRKRAYWDCPLGIGEDQTISQPYIVAIMTQYLELKGDEKVLEIGTGSGYQAAVLAELAQEVYSIEIVESLYQGATQILKELGYDQVKTKLGDGYLGWSEYAPFDRIIITCSVTRVPEPLIKQLNDSGLIVLPIGETFSESVLTVVRKQNGKITYEPVLPCRFVPMTGQMQEKEE